MKIVKFTLMLTFGLLGTVYTALGAAVLYTRLSPALGYVFLPLGIAFLAATFCVWYFFGRSQRRRQELLTWGTRATATVTEVQTNLNLRVNRRNPKVVLVTCTHPITRETVTLRSHNVMDCTLQPGQTVDIAFDPMNERRYIFDLTEDRP